MIVKNTVPINTVYNIDSKVSKHSSAATAQTLKTVQPFELAISKKFGLSVLRMTIPHLDSISHVTPIFVLSFIATGQGHIR